MRCKFCFATFQNVDAPFALPAGHLPEAQAVQVVRELATYGFQKINFVGGEPTLCPWLPTLIRIAHQEGMTTSIVTNGSRLTTRFLEENQPYLDWIGVSIDSLSKTVNLESGRAINGRRTLSHEAYRTLFDTIKTYGYRSKINTVVHRLNHLEDLTDFIDYAAPERWKVFQVLRMKGENDTCFDRFEISDREFQSYLDRHRGCSVLVAEDNEAMRDSYVMINPAGQFFDNGTGRLREGPGITEVGIEQAIQPMHYSWEKFRHRGGVYDWA